MRDFTPGLVSSGQTEEDSFWMRPQVSSALSKWKDSGETFLLASSLLNTASRKVRRLLLLCDDVLEIGLECVMRFVSPLSIINVNNVKVTFVLVSLG